MLILNRAGVAGLTTALLLSKKPGYKVVVAAKHMPSDYDIEYASPWAGANYMPYVQFQLLFMSYRFLTVMAQCLGWWNRGSELG